MNDRKLSVFADFESFLLFLNISRRKSFQTVYDVYRSIPEKKTKIKRNSFFQVRQESWLLIPDIFSVLK